MKILDYNFLSFMAALFSKYLPVCMHRRRHGRGNEGILSPPPQDFKRQQAEEAKKKTL